MRSIVPCKDRKTRRKSETGSESGYFSRFYPAMQEPQAAAEKGPKQIKGEIRTGKLKGVVFGTVRSLCENFTVKEIIAGI